jgi:hypothetical protein
MGWAKAKPIVWGRCFGFAFPPNPFYISWTLNHVVGFEISLSRCPKIRSRRSSMLRHIRVYSKHELSERLMAFIGDINREPVVHT